MEFTYYGGNSVLITTKDLKVLIDQGVNSQKLKAQAVLSTTLEKGQFKNKDENFSIDSPGEYEIKSVGIHGIPARLHVDEPKAPKRGIMYVVEYRGVRALITGNIAPILTDRQVEQIGAVDVLVVPVGGHGLTLDANAASALVSRFEPSYVIPTHYDDGKTKYEMPQDKVESFLKEMGSEEAREVPKLKIAEKDLLEGTSIVVLSLQT